MINADDPTIYDLPTSVTQRKTLNIGARSNFARPTLKAGSNAWVAGLFDMRGWVRIQKRQAKHRMSYSIRAYIRVPNEWRARELMGMYGGTAVKGQSGKSWIWATTYQTALTFLRRIRPHVRWKREVINTAERFERLRKVHFNKRFVAVSVLEQYEELSMALTGRVPPEAASGIAKDRVKADLERFNHVK